MELKLDSEIDWYDLPKIRSPFFAAGKVEHGDPISGQVKNLDILSPGSRSNRRTIEKEVIDALEQGHVCLLKDRPTCQITIHNH